MPVKNFLSLEALRAWMAWWVVVGHAVGLAGLPSWIPAPIVKLLSGGGIAVNVFIIVSGFVITHLLLAKKEAYSTYLARRWFRIFPIYLFCIVLSIFLSDWYSVVFIEPSWNNLREMRIERIAETESNWHAHLFAHLSMLHGVIPDSALKYSVSSILAPAWSISLEWQFYILAPLLFWIATRNTNWGGILVFLLLCGWVISEKFLSSEYQYPAMLFLSIQFFLVGIFSRLLLEKLPPIKISPLAMYLAPLPVFTYFKNIELTIWWLFYIFCLIECSILKGRINAGRKGIGYWFMQCVAINPTLRYLGRISYSTYLAHIPTFVIVCYLYGGGLAISSQPQMQEAVILAMLACIPISALLYHAIELPFIKIGGAIANYMRVNNPPKNRVGAKNEIRA